MEKSTHRVEIVPIKLEPHPNADSLSIVPVFGYNVVVRTEDWKDKAIGAYVVPDSVVDTSKPWFTFLAGHCHVKVRRFRGVLSQGLLVPAPDGSIIGDDVASQLGVTRYESPISYVTGGDCESGPVGHYPKYDLESWHRYGQYLRDGEHIYITEKLHGANSRYVYAPDKSGEMKFHIGSHETWKKNDDNILWVRLARLCPWIEEWCRSYPRYALYGEVFGNVQKLKYCAAPGQIWFRVFDIMSPEGAWVSVQDRIAWIHSDNLVPLLYSGKYSKEAVLELSRGKSTLADHLKEGIVIEPAEDRYERSCGRVKLKLVSDEYLEKGKE